MGYSIADRIAELLKEKSRTHTIKTVLVGLSYTAVELEDSAIGVAFNFPQARGGCTETLRKYKPFAGKEASVLLSLLGEKELIGASIGMATANALKASEPLQEEVFEGDVLDCIETEPTDKVCMVGCFVPLLNLLKERGIGVVALDETPKPGSRPPEEAERYLPQSDIALITATSIINHTIDHLLELSTSCREVAILGPSTPFIPGAFLNTPVTILSGVKIDNGKEVMDVIGEGGGFREFKKSTRKVNIPLKAR